MENLLLKTPYKFKKSYGGVYTRSGTADPPGCTLAARTLS
jgi:hypothetical protein